MTRRLRIAQIGSRGIPGHRGGVDRVVEAVAPRLVQFGHDVVVYCANWSPYQEPSYKGVELTYVYTPRRKYLDTFVRSLLATVRDLLGPSDVVHFHSCPSASFALLSRLFGKKVVVTVHGREWQRRKWVVFGRWFLHLSEWCAVRLPHRTVVVGPISSEPSMSATEQTSSTSRTASRCVRRGRRTDSRYGIASGTTCCTSDGSYPRSSAMSCSTRSEAWSGERG